MPPGSSAPGIEAALDVSLVLAGRRPQLVGLGLDVGLGLVGLGHRGGARRAARRAGAGERFSGVPAAGADGVGDGAVSGAVGRREPDRPQKERTPQ